MAAFVHYTDPLLVYNDSAYYGENWRDCRNAFFGLELITFTDGGLLNTQWYRDQGPTGMATATKEPRAFCARGALAFSITDCNSLVLRLNTAYSWYTAATVLVNGVAPSTLGLLTAEDTVSCDSLTYGLFVDAYIDVLVLDGLVAASTYNIEIVVDNADATKFFSIAGYKTGGLFTQDSMSTKTTYIIDGAENITQNHITVSVKNRQDVPILDVTLALAGTGPVLMNSDGTAYTDFTAAAIQVGETLTKVWAPDWLGNEATQVTVGDLYDYIATLSAFYPDPAGATVLPTPFILAANSVAITYNPSPWIADSATPDGSPRIFAISQSTGGFPWCAIFDFDGDALDITTQRSSGWGVVGIYDGPTLGAALLNSYTCAVDEGGAFHTYNLTGFGAGPHTVYLRKTVNDALPVIFVRAAWTADASYTEETEVFTISIPGQQPIPMAVENVEVGTYDATFDQPDLAAHDYVSDVVRTNLNVTTTEVMTRFPTFAVCYQPGFREILSGYDILIVDPIGSSTADVQYWQALGIKVFGYISSGEEIGFYEDRYDFATGLAPRPGAGPGGYSTNYMFTREPITGPPDRNGVWSSYYMNPDPASGWPQRIFDYYAPQVFGGPEVVVEEVVTTLAHTITAGARIVFDTAKSPLDSAETITLTTMDEATTYVIYQDYTFDIKTGAFVLSPTITPAVTAGQQLKISYTRKGHDFDGMFWDTVDTPDVYSGPAFGYEYVAGYSQHFINMLNNFGAAYPDKHIIFNRGFTILDSIIAGGKAVMFETWLTHPDTLDFATTDYHRVTDPVYVHENTIYHEQLRRLRTKYVFDVLSLNYALPADTALKEYCRSKDAQMGYLSWQTVINLNNPEHNTTINTPSPPITTNAFTVYKRKSAQESLWDGGGSVWDAGSSSWD